MSNIYVISFCYWSRYFVLIISKAKSVVSTSIKHNITINSHCLPLTEGSWWSGRRRQFLRAGGRSGASPGQKRSHEDGGRGRRHRRGKSSQEDPILPLLGTCYLFAPRVRLPLHPLRLHHGGPGSLPGAHPPAPLRGGRRPRAAVPAVWGLLHLRSIPVPPPLHHPQGQRHGPRQSPQRPP